MTPAEQAALVEVMTSRIMDRLRDELPKFIVQAVDVRITAQSDRYARANLELREAMQVLATALVRQHGAMAQKVLADFDAHVKQKYDEAETLPLAILDVRAALARAAQAI
jgi:hypothetical protein